MYLLDAGCVVVVYLMDTRFTVVAYRVDASSEVFLKVKLILFLDTLILYMYFFDNKIDNFRGDLSTISAKTATLDARCAVIVYVVDTRCAVDLCVA